MNKISLLFIFAAIYCLIKIMYIIMAEYEYKKKQKQFLQLKRIYYYFSKVKVNPKEAEEVLSTDIKIESGWLYSDYFFFNLNDGDYFKKMKKYLLEIMSFYLKNSNYVDKKMFEAIVEFKKELNIVA